MFLNLRFSSDPATATAADSAEVAVRQLTANSAATAEDGDEVQSISSTRQDSADHVHGEASGRAVGLG